MQKLRLDMDIGTTIRGLRKQKHMTQNTIVTKMQLMGCKLSRMTYSKMERNQYNIKISELVALKIIFDVSFDAFFADLEKEIGSIDTD